MRRNHRAHIIRLVEHVTGHTATILAQMHSVAPLSIVVPADIPLDIILLGIILIGLVMETMETLSHVAAQEQTLLLLNVALSKSVVLVDLLRIPTLQATIPTGRVMEITDELQFLVAHIQAALAQLNVAPSKIAVPVAMSQIPTLQGVILIGHVWAPMGIVFPVALLAQVHHMHNVVQAEIPVQAGTTQIHMILAIIPIGLVTETMEALLLAVHTTTIPTTHMHNVVQASIVVTAVIHQTPILQATTHTGPVMAITDEAVFHAASMEAILLMLSVEQVSIAV